MENEDDRFDAYHRPPPMPRERLWEAIEAADRHPPVPSRRLPGLARIAAGLALMLAGAAAGFTIGRASAIPDARGDQVSGVEAGDIAGPDRSRTIVWF